ncbi:peptide cleavage/export ABC transporter [Fructobacillus sp. M2-14]|uniref:Peptide cleavage/export ABC transporter n=1 Tax=Fructobacillus broussonetiae TaxID=2713173 RepID=A0ABS5R0Q5_9LACO|nr:peptide cleavage/export ABC transporter [Fructobacillus broussonetiae]MBS9339033.1 peptide cleavage/export ABC transporter [Fructobacillus broussonetiae]
MKIRYIAQVDERDCGAAALAMVLSAYGKELSIAKVRHLIKTNLDGSSALGIKVAAESFGLSTTALKADASLFDDRQPLPLPAIAHVVKPAGKHLLEHYYVIEKVTAKGIHILDPDNQVKRKVFTKAEFQEQWSGVILFFEPKTTFEKSAQGKTPGLRAFFPIIWRQKSILKNIVCATMLTTIIAIAGSGFLQQLVDHLIPAGEVHTLTMASLVILGAYAFQQIMAYTQQYLLVVFGQRLSIDVLIPYAKHLFKLPMDFYYTRRVGEITSRFNDANTIIEAVARTVLSLVIDVGTVLMMGVVLFLYSPLLCLLAVLAIPLYAVVMAAFVSPLHKNNLKVLQAGAEVESAIIESVSGMETIKALGAEATAYEKIDQNYVAFLRASFKKNQLSIVEDSIKMFIKLAFQVLVLWQGGKLVIKGQLTVGELVAFNALLAYFTEPLQTLLNLQDKLQTAVVAAKRLNEVFEVESEFKEVKTMAPATTNPLIEFKDVCFEYQHGHPILAGVNFKVDRGDKVALVGGSGSGKSTLAKLLVSFLEIEQGEGVAKYKGLALNRVDKKVLRSEITYVPQEAQVFTGTILDNLLMGCLERPTPERIREACELACIDEDIQKMSQGYASEISSSGSLSGGQRQRLALARALLQESSVLILDESTSNLDRQTEKKVIDNLLKLKDKTIIFVAHRLAIAERVDRVIMIESGKVVGDDSHEALLKNNHYYQRLVEG